MKCGQDLAKAEGESLSGELRGSGRTLGRSALLILLGLFSLFWALGALAVLAVIRSRRMRKIREQVPYVADLLARGRRADAVIVSMRRMGRIGDLGLAGPTDERADDELFLMELEVDTPWGDAVSSRVLHRVPDHLVGRVGLGVPATGRVRHRGRVGERAERL